MADVVIFAPSPVLSITIEEHPDGGDVHVHAGGQGVWQARMLLAMGCSVDLCSVLSGETGMVQGFLLREEGIGVAALSRKNRGAVYVHDRRGGERIEIIESGGDPLTRHELDELYEPLDDELLYEEPPYEEEPEPLDGAGGVPSYQYDCPH